MTVLKTPRRLAVSTHEVTVQQFRQFQLNEFKIRPTPAAKEVFDESYPATVVSFLDALGYCRWLSEQEGIAEDQMCYPPIPAIGPRDANLTPERQGRTGYRLPTVEEWAFAANAGAASPSSAGGSPVEHLTQFAWCAPNSGNQLHLVGMLWPNPLGLFDAFGNASEWCHPDQPAGNGSDKGTLRGGNYTLGANELRNNARADVEHDTGYSFTGFRIVRTLAPGLQQQGE